MKVLLLGATGLLGHNVLLRLMAEGHEVVALVRKADGIRLGTEKGRWQTVVGSPLDFDTLLQASQGCDAVVNCAGATNMALLHYSDFLPANRDLPKMIARLVKEHGIRCLVHVSTVNTIGYGTAGHPANEQSPMMPPFKGSYYADSKLEGEKEILSVAVDGNHVVVINAGYMLGDYDVKPSSGRMLLAAYKRPLMLVPKGGKAFVHVKDVAEAVVAALSKGENGQRYIVTSSKGCYTIRQLYELQAKVCGYKQLILPLPGWLMIIAGGFGDCLRAMGVRTQLSTRNVRQLLVREYYDNHHGIKDLGFHETSIADAIKDFFEWRKISLSNCTK
jgi:nucleoside-diphosphate-sugar epimerase